MDAIINIDKVLNTNLTKEQKQAAVDLSDEVLCLACAGSGKSRTLSYRIGYLFSNGVIPENVLAFTFTEKAADSLKRNVATAIEQCGFTSDLVGAMFIGTIHSYCQHILGQMDARYRQFEVLDENKMKIYLLSRYYDLSLNELGNAKDSRMFNTIKEVANAWSTLNDELIQISDIEEHDPILAKVLNKLKQSLDQDEFIDFSLMIRLVADALERDDIEINNVLVDLKHVMVDEYQDVCPSQEALIRGLHRRSQTLFVVGDDDQSIYGWRGADIQNILNFEERYPACSTHTLNTNFRSTDKIVNTSNEFIHNELGPARHHKNPVAHNNGNIEHYGKYWFPSREEESHWVANRIKDLIGTEYVERYDKEGNPIESRGLSEGDFAILFRSIRRPFNPDNLPNRHYEFIEALRELGFEPTVESEGGIFERPHARIVRDIMELLRGETPKRNDVILFYKNNVMDYFPHADQNKLIQTLMEWNRKINTPQGSSRVKVYPQDFYQNILEALNVDNINYDEQVMRDLGVFSTIILDIEQVYVSIDSKARYNQMLNFLSNVAESGYDVSTLDLVTKPDAVTISTIHKMKGLEYPVVFIVDVLDRRFPGDRSRYRGWLPEQVMDEAINRGSYGKTREDEARLFYTALTRAERFLYVTGSAEQPDTRREKKPSKFLVGLGGDSDFNDPNELPSEIKYIEPKKRYDENDLPTSYTEIKDYLTCPAKYQFRQHFGFNSPVPDLFGFGLTTHTAINKLHQDYNDSPPTSVEAMDVTEEVFHLKHAFPSRDPENNPGPYERAKERAKEIVSNYVESHSMDFTRTRASEARFEIKVEKALISGSIDLLLKMDEEGNILDAEVIDFKSLDRPSNHYEWLDLSLQVQLYAHAGQEIHGEPIEFGSVHLLKDNERINVPVNAEAKAAAISNIEWAVDYIIKGEFPMRPSSDKCESCDFKKLCRKQYQEFSTEVKPPEIYLPSGFGKVLARAFSDID
ncbi:ATP-dependent DNA helicase [Bacillus sp. Marseille-Q3570]|uniref:ATP-dependent helicase n=1 Tax=Bacillus sp. Marseille-Q3570 TaxID=2963522 RepID=UPI0021B7D466|nr:ATP-dependent DNA helicase [Bacillus sp. Marseille-Q3570]